jgi:hypothetical protein
MLFGADLFCVVETFFTLVIDDAEVASTLTTVYYDGVVDVVIGAASTDAKDDVFLLLLRVVGDDVKDCIDDIIDALLLVFFGVPHDDDENEDEDELADVDDRVRRFIGDPTLDIG